MSLLQRIKKSLAEAGVSASLVKIYGMFVDYRFDLKYGTDTVSKADLVDLDIKSANRTEGIRYQPSRVLPIRRLFSEIQPDLPENPVLVDLGCGKGRVLMLAAASHIQDVRGVEFAQELCEVARKNSEAFVRIEGPSSKFSIHHGDATQYSFSPEENVFFMYNPFKRKILQQVLQNLTQSLHEHPRRVLLIYHQADYKEVVDNHPDLFLSRVLKFWGYTFYVYSNEKPI